MSNQIMLWCRKICERTGTDFNYFIGKLSAQDPKTELEAEAMMDQLLYQAWHEDYELMWDLERTCDLLMDLELPALWELSHFH